MRVETLQELEQDDPKLEIPWASPENPSLRYQDLKSFPKLILELEEVLKFPALGPFLQILNGPNSRFRTAKCDVWSTRELAEEERVELGRVYKLGVYVDLVFEKVEFNFSIKHYLRLGKKLEGVSGTSDSSVQVEFTIRRCFFQDKSSWGYYATLFLHAYGDTPAYATRKGTQALEALGQEFGNISKTH